MERHTGENRNFSTNIPLEETPKIKQSIIEYLGSPALLDKFLKASPHLLIRFRLFLNSPKLLGYHLFKRGTMDIRYNTDYAENGVPIHEFIHEAVSNLEERGADEKSVNKRNRLVDSIINDVISKVMEDVYENNSRATLERLGLSRGRYSENVTGNAEHGGRGGYPNSRSSIPGIDDSKSSNLPRGTKLPVTSESTSKRGKRWGGHDVRLDDSELQPFETFLAIVKPSLPTGDFNYTVQLLTNYFMDIFNSPEMSPQAKLAYVGSFISAVKAINPDIANKTLNNYDIRQEIMGYGSMLYIPQNTLQDLVNLSLDELTANSGAKSERRLKMQKEHSKKNLSDGHGATSSNDPVTVKEEVEKANQPDPTDMKSNPIETTINQIERI